MLDVGAIAVHFGSFYPYHRAPFHGWNAAKQ